ncbi:MAG: substrate-binding domain-containing protein, partial [Acidimicrobiia bacterium]
IGAEGVPVGDYTRMAWKRLGEQGLHENVVSVEQDTRSIVAKVALGEADAGFAYATDARAAGSTVSVIQLPPEAQPRVTYLMAVVTRGQNRELAGSFVRKVIGAPGRAALSRAGFGPP